MFIIELGGEAVGLIQCYRHADHPDWDRAVGIKAAAGIDYLIGEASQCGRGIGSTAIASFSPQVFAWYPDVDVIVAAPQPTTTHPVAPWRRPVSPWLRNVDSTPTTPRMTDPVRSTPSHDLGE
jgi:hypothetical protein